MGVEKGEEFEMEKLRNQKTDQTNNNFENGHSRKNKIIAGISVIVIILTLVMGYVVISSRERQVKVKVKSSPPPPPHHHHPVTIINIKLNPEQNNVDNNDNSDEPEEEEATIHSPRKSELFVISIKNPESRNNLSDVMKSPKATLENPEEFYFNQPGDLNPNCSVLPLRFRRGPRILNTFFTCVRLYNLENCVGKSTAYYPKIPKFDLEDGDAEAYKNRVNITIQQEVRSIGPCFVNELDQSLFHFSKENGLKEFQKTGFPSASTSSFKIRIQNRNKNPAAVPDVVRLSPDMKMNQEVDQDPTETFVHRDENGRLILARVFISSTSQDLMSNDTDTDTNTTEEEIPSSKSKLNEEMTDKNQNDALGHFIHPKFSSGLKTDDNTFFQSPWNRKIVEVVEIKIENYINENPDEKLELMVQVEYQNDKMLENNFKISQRPTGFFYRIRYSKDAQIETYYFTNP